MDVSDNILTAGIRLRKEIMDATGLKDDKVFPITTSVDMEMPFVTYFRASVEEDTVKSQQGPRTGHFVVQVYSAGWSEGIELASQIASRLDAYAGEGITVCRLEDATENFDPSVPAFMQVLYFKVKI